jgi:steroid delta-isomerase-like uncharacterized protein
LIASQSLASESRDHKREAAVWYQAFSGHDPRLLDTVLADNWYETPSAERGGREVGMRLLVSLTTVFPDFKIEIKDMIQEGNKVVVRSEITGTQAAPFMGFPSRHQKISIQAIDIHEFEGGKIVHTWHSEDWMTGLRQMGALDNPSD